MTRGIFPFTISPRPFIHSPPCTPSYPSDLILSIPSFEARRSCEGILALVKSLDKDLHIQHFSRKNVFVKGLKTGEIKLGSGGFVLMLIQNILNKGYMSVHQLKKDFVFAGSRKPPVSDLRNHFISEAKNLIELRNNNTIGYREKVAAYINPSWERSEEISVKQSLKIK